MEEASRGQISQGSVLAGVGCSLVRGLFLVYDLLSYVVYWYKQTGSASSWLQDCPGAGTLPGAEERVFILTAMGSICRFSQRVM